MSASAQRPRQKNRKKFNTLFPHTRKSGSCRPSALVFFLSSIILVETLLLLFLIPKRTTFQESVPTSKMQTRLRERSSASKKTTTAPVLREHATIVKREVAKAQKGKIAIVLDDWGYNTKNLDLLRQIKVPLTLSILPFHVYSRTVAEFAHRNKLHVMIHMPMEPKNKERVGLEPRTLMTYMGSETINRTLNEAFENIPYAEGINNHMGSLATEDEALITEVFHFVKKKNLFFLDSQVTTRSVCFRLSKEMGIKFTRRSVFLDNSSDQEYIKNQLAELTTLSDKHGRAIGIGHDRGTTIKVLVEEIPKLQKKGYRFVFVSEFVEEYEE